MSGVTRAALIRPLPALGVAALTGCTASPSGFGALAGRTAVTDEDDVAVPYVPTPPAMVAAMLDLARVGPGDRLIDLGSGDGRIPIAAARRGAQATGVEIDGALVQRAIAQAAVEGLSERVRFTRADLFATPIRDASVVTLYLLPRVNLALRPRLLTELRPGSRVVSHAFDMGDWAPDDRRVVDHRVANLWIVPAVAGGDWLLTLSDGRALPLRINQRFQTVVGTLGDLMIEEASLAGTRLRFLATIDGTPRAVHGIVGEQQISPDPGAPADALRGWLARRPG